MTHLTHLNACPHCNYLLDLGATPMVGQQLLCPICNAQLEIISDDPLEVDWIFLEPQMSGLTMMPNPPALSDSSDYTVPIET